LLDTIEMESNTDMDTCGYKNGICPIDFTLRAIGGKWKLLILYYLMNDGVKRYGELKKSITGITHKMLSQQLKELESDGLIHREEYHQIPPKVEYSLSEKGVTLLPILGAMQQWGRENMQESLIQ
jgi:DNA-binding HxlR family transcriptional regulator